MLATGCEILFDCILCPHPEQISHFPFRGQTDSGIVMEHSLSTVWAAVGQSFTFKAVMTDIAVIESHNRSPQSSSGDSSSPRKSSMLMIPSPATRTRSSKEIVTGGDFLRAVAVPVFISISLYTGSILATAPVRDS